MRDVQEYSTLLRNRMPPAWAVDRAGGYDYLTRRSGFVIREVDAQYRVTGGYESDGSEHRSLASIPVAPGAHWTATLTVPIGGGDVAFLQVERQGELPAGYRGAEVSALLSLPIGEVDALIELLGGVVAQARRDGVLPVE